MKLAGEVSDDKLRGGFYTPPDLVEVCLGRIRELLAGSSAIRLLEPTVGDGAFVRALAEPWWRERIAHLTGIELLDLEANKARSALRNCGVAGEILTGSSVSWAAASADEFDAAVGNPPFVRFQFISDQDRAAIGALGERLGLTFRGVSNLWIPVLLGALCRLRGGGAFAFVVPTECLTGCAAETLRRWFVGECTAVRFDLFPPGSFPGVLQEVAVVSGRRQSGASPQLHLRFVEHHHDGGSAEWTHRHVQSASWTQYLLGADQVDAIAVAREGSAIRNLGELAAFEVSIVTGANDFFSIDGHTRQAADLQAWSRDLLPRIRHAPGVVYTAADHAATQAAGAKAWLLDFAADADNPMRFAGPRQYIESGERRGLHERFKCRIREPWYRVPNLRRGELLLSKRSHHFPRVIVNEAEVFTTDTIYRGRMRDPGASAPALAAAFHNSLTLLTAELEGRSFGGGVLELVPSEIARLAVPASDALLPRLGDFDGRAREGDLGGLVALTDQALVEAGLVSREVMTELVEARAHLVQRRLDRNAGATVKPPGRDSLKLAA
jgi:adenine-specific DNA methylase